jgi:hypothetical protein
MIWRCFFLAYEYNLAVVRPPAPSGSLCSSTGAVAFPYIFSYIPLIRQIRRLRNSPDENTAARRAEIAGDSRPETQ